MGRKIFKIEIKGLLESDGHIANKVVIKVSINRKIL
jgi:hypothetical protein